MLLMYVKLMGLALLPAGITLSILKFKKHSSFDKLPAYSQSLIIGVIYGLIAIFGTEFGVSVDGKAMANARDAAPLIAGLVFGGHAGIIAGLIGGIERYFSVYWGVGEYTRMACTVSTIIAGFFAAFVRKHLFNNKMPLPIFGLIIGIVMETFHMTTVLITHLNNSQIAFSILRVLSLPMLLANSISVYFTILLVKKIFIKDENKYQSYKNISTKIQIYLLYVVIAAFIFTSLFTYTLQTKDGERRAEELLKEKILTVENYTRGGNSIEDFQEIIDSINVSNKFYDEPGMVAIFDKNKKLLTGTPEYRNKTMDELGIIYDEEHNKPQELSRIEVNYIHYYGMYDKYLDYYILSTIDFDTVFIDRDNNFLHNSYMEILIYAIVFYVVYLIITKLVVGKINNINEGLAKITQGNLNIIIDESDTIEFASLSNDINLTVSSLKTLMEEEKERMQKDLIFAKKIQSSSLPSLFPAFPNVPYFDIYATMKTAKEVGGDFYDFYFCDKNILTFLIADVSGKGVPAAMFMMTAKTMIKNFSNARYDIVEIVNNVNNELCSGNDAGMFVTSFIGQFNIKTGHIDYINCGHNPPILIHDNKATYLDSKKDFVLAGLEGFSYQKQSLDLSAGDRLYLYTDGVTEAMNDKKELYSEQRLLDIFNDKLLDKTIYDSLKNIQEDIDIFANGAEQADDITMLEIIYNGGK